MLVKTRVKMQTVVYLYLIPGLNGRGNLHWCNYWRITFPNKWKLSKTPLKLSQRQAVQEVFMIKSLYSKIRIHVKKTNQVRQLHMYLAKTEKSKETSTLVLRVSAAHGWKTEFQHSRFGTNLRQRSFRSLERQYLILFQKHSRRTHRAKLHVWSLYVLGSCVSIA